MNELWIAYFFWQRRHCLYKQFIITHCLELIKWLHVKAAEYQVSTYFYSKSQISVAKEIEGAAEKKPF